MGRSLMKGPFSTNSYLQRIVWILRVPQRLVIGIRPANTRLIANTPRVLITPRQRFFEAHGRLKINPHVAVTVDTGRKRTK